MTHPVVSGPTSPYSFVEQGTLDIHGTGFAVADADAGDAAMSAVFSVDTGYLSIDVGDSGVTVVSNNSTGTVAVSGSTAQLNMLLAGNGTGTIVYRHDQTSDSDTPPAAATITLTVNDQGNTGSDLGDTADINSEEDTASQLINITAVNDAPVLTSIESTPLVYTENDPPTVLTSSVAVGDVDNDTIESAVVAISGNYVNGEDVLAFTDQNGISGSWIVDTGELILTGTASKAQYETALRSISYVNISDSPTGTARTVSFTLSDGSDNSNTQTRDVNLIAVNDAPTDLQISNTAIVENTDTSDGLSIGTLSSTDVDAEETFTYSVVGGSDADLFSIDVASGNELILTDGVLNFERQRSYAAIIRTTDSGGLTHDQMLTINVTDVNDGPVITSSGAVRAAENQTRVQSVTTSESANGMPVFSLVGGADAALFAIDALSGALTFKIAPDFETAADAGANNIYDVTVQVNDGRAGTAIMAVAVTVTDVNEAPIIQGVTDAVANGGDETAELVVDENQTAVTTVSATDVDEGDNLVFTLTDGVDRSAFTIDSATGAISFVAAPDFEMKDRFELQVSVTDRDGLTAVQRLIIDVRDVDEFPTAQTDILEASENEPLLIDPVASLFANDVDPEQDTLTLVSFTQPRNGTLTLNAQNLLVYEPADGFSGTDQFEYVVQDSGGNQVRAQVSLDVIASASALLAAAEPEDNEITEASETLAELGIPDTPSASMENLSAFEQEEDVVSSIDSATADNFTQAVEAAEPISDSDRIASADSFTDVVSTSAVLVDLAAPTAEQAPPDRPDSPAISPLLAQLLKNGTFDLNTDVSFQDVEQSLSNELRNAIFLLRDQIEQIAEQSSDAAVVRTFAPSVVGASLTAGIVSWVLRSGLLISASVSATPLWRPLDPTPILASTDDDEPWYDEGVPDDSDDSLQNANMPADKDGKGGKDE